jgi:hypothetical protein
MVGKLLDLVTVVKGQSEEYDSAELVIYLTTRCCSRRRCC